MIPADWRGPALYSTGILCGTLLDAVIKELAERYDTGTIFFARSVFGLLGMLLIYGWKPVQLKTAKLAVHGLRGVIVAVAAATFYYSLGALPLVLVYVIAMTAPLMMVALSGLILREPASKRDWIKVALGFSGIVISVAPHLLTGGDLPLLGLLACLIGTVGYAASTLAIRPLTTTETTAAIAFYPMLVAVILSGGVMLADPPAALPSSGDFALMALAGALVCAINLLLTAAFRLAPATRLAPFEYTCLLWGVGLGYVWFAEVPTVWMLAGAGLVVWATSRRGGA